jgi:hypothetical protein
MSAARAGLERSGRRTTHTRTAATTRLAAPGAPRRGPAPAALRGSEHRCSCLGGQRTRTGLYHLDPARSGSLRPQPAVTGEVSENTDEHARIPEDENKRGGPAAIRSTSRRVVRASSWPGTCATPRSNEWLQQSARERWPPALVKLVASVDAALQCATPRRRPALRLARIRLRDGVNCLRRTVRRRAQLRRRVS